MRILYVSGEVAPFTKKSQTAHLVRALPEQIHETEGFETRIMTPRYGIISERRNRLHEVIRLSGAEIPSSEGPETLKVKVASIPGIRLQVYFMDNAKLFKRKGIYATREGKLFADNAERALFFGRSVLETIRKLGWKPDVVHAFGWMSGMVPMLLRTQYANDPLFEDAKVVYTPDFVDFEASLTETAATTLDVVHDPRVVGQQPVHVGLDFADAVLYPHFLTPEDPATPQLPEEAEARHAFATQFYDQMVGVPV